MFYSPRTDFPDGAPLQAFIAIGEVTDDEPYQVTMGADFEPWRRRVDFLPVRETPIRPLVDDLDFVEDKSRWGSVSACSRSLSTTSTSSAPR